MTQPVALALGFDHVVPSLSPERAHRLPRHGCSLLGLQPAAAAVFREGVEHRGPAFEVRRHGEQGARLRRAHRRPRNGRHADVALRLSRTHLRHGLRGGHPARHHHARRGSCLDLRRSRFSISSPAPATGATPSASATASNPKAACAYSTPWHPTPPKAKPTKGVYATEASCDNELTVLCDRLVRINRRFE